MKAILLGASIAGSILAAGSAFAVSPPAAELKQIQGAVLVNQGESYRTALEGMPLQVGDRIMVMEGGAMVMVYQDGCVAEFKENQIITVETISTCEGGMAASVPKGPLYADPLGGGGGAGGAGGVGVFLGAAGLGGLGFALAKDDDDPISGN